VAELQRETGGNPFYLRQLARSAAPPTPAVPIMAADGELPAPVLAAIGHEVGQLPDAARALLQAAAVAGDPFELDVAGRVAELAEAEALGALDALVAHELVRASDLPRRFTFRHPIVRRAVYESLPPGRRIAAHRRAADALQEIGAPAAVQAHHLAPSAARGDERALAVFTEAATGAGTRAPAAAAHWLEAALRLLGPEDARRLALLGPLATALAAIGRLDEARTRLLEALELLPPGTAVIRAALIAVLAAVEHLLGLHEDASARLRAGPGRDRGRGLAGGLRAPGRARVGRSVRDRLGADAGVRGPRARARAGARRRRADRRRGGGDGVRRAVRARSRGRAGALRRGGRGARRDRRRGAGRAPGRAYMLGWTEHFLERYEDALRHLDRGIAVSRATGQGQFFLPMTLGKVMALCAVGRLEEAGELAESAVEGARLAANDQLLAWALWERCWAAALAATSTPALPAGTESVRLGGRLEFNVLTRAGHLAYAYALLEAGEPDGALEQLRLGGADRPGFEPASQCLWYEQLVRGRAGPPARVGGRGVGAPVGRVCERARPRVRRRDGSAGRRARAPRGGRRGGRGAGRPRVGRRRAARQGAGPGGAGARARGHRAGRGRATRRQAPSSSSARSSNSTPAAPSAAATAWRASCAGSAVASLAAGAASPAAERVPWRR
jgi:tetratricopeptide (TPR) repeat protein